MNSSLPRIAPGSGVDPRDVPFASPPPPSAPPSDGGGVMEVPENERLGAVARRYHVDSSPGAAVANSGLAPAYVKRLYTDRRDFFEDLEARRRRDEAARKEAEVCDAVFVPTVTPHPVHAFNQHTNVVDRMLMDVARRRTEHQPTVMDALVPDASRSSSATQRTGTTHDRAATPVDPNQGAVLPRVAREYSVAQREHEMHIAYLRERHEHDTAPTFRPTIHRQVKACPTSNAEPRHVPAPAVTAQLTAADAFRAAAIAKQRRAFDDSKANPLDDESHRRKRDALLQRRIHERQKEADAAHAATTTAVVANDCRETLPRTTTKILSKAEASAVAQRLYVDGRRRNDPAALQAEAAKERAADRERQRAAAEERRKRYAEAMLEHDRLAAEHAAEEARRLQVQLKPEQRPDPPALESVRSAAADKMKSGEPTNASRVPNRACQTSSRDHEGIAALESTVAMSAVQAASIQKRSEDAALALRLRRERAEAMRKEKRDAELALQAAAEARYLRPAPSSTTSAVTSSHVIRRGASAAHRNANDGKPQPPPEAVRLPSASPSDPAAAVAATATSDAKSLADAVRGMDAVMRRKQLAESLKLEAEAKLRVKPAAVQRVRDAKGRLVTRVDPFAGLESHEQRTFEHKVALLQAQDFIDTPFQHPISANGYYYRTQHNTADFSTGHTERP